MRFDNLEVERIAVISISHLSQTTNNVLAGASGMSASRGCHAVDQSAYGYTVRPYGDDPSAYACDALPDLRVILNTLCVSGGFDGVRFDADANVLAELQTFDW